MPHVTLSVRETGRAWLAATALGLTAAMHCGVAVAQRPRAPVTQLGTDLVVLQTGQRLHGVLIDQDAEQLTLVLERAWLAETYPDLAESWQAEEQEQRREARETQTRRLARWLEQSEGADQLQLYLRAELRRLQAEPQPEARPELPRFLLRRIPVESVRSSFRQPPERRQVCLLAWKHQIPGATHRASSALLRELREAGVEQLDEEVDLSDELPRVAENARQWAIRQAVIEHRLKQPLDFQGTEGNLVRVERDRPAALPELLSTVLAGQLRQALAGLEGRSTQATIDLEKPIAAAEREGLRGFTVTVLRLDLAGTGAAAGSVVLQFVARLPSGAWEVVWETTAPVEVAADPPPDLAEDPQVQAALELLKQLGLQPDAAQQSLTLRVGGGVRKALSQVQARFRRQQERALSP